MVKSELSEIQETARKFAINKIKKQLEKNREFYKLKKLKELIKNGAV